MKVYAVVPAKAKSRRLPGKNFSRFGESNLLAHCVQKLLDSRIPERIYISTDNVGKVQQALRDVPGRGRVLILVRPPKLATDSARTEEVVADVVARINVPEDYAILLCQATTPLWTVEHLQQAFRLFQTHGCPALVAVRPDYTPNGAFWLLCKHRFEKTGELYQPDMEFYEMDWISSIDIDYPHQLTIAESIYRQLRDGRHLV